MDICPATHRDSKAIVSIIMQAQGAHVSRRGTVVQVERMLNAARRRPDYLVLVAKKHDRVRGFLSAMRTMRHGLWEDRSVWQVQFLMGRNVLRPLVAEMRRIAGAIPVLMQVAWTDDPRSGSMDVALRRMGFTEYSTVLVAEGEI